MGASSVTFDAKLLAQLQSRYAKVHPLVFHRSVERAKSPGDLFDILETMPDSYPIIWDDGQHRWVKTDDMLRVNAFNEKIKEGREK